jgi:putative ABC transport system ATP-binding protein
MTAAVPETVARPIVEIAHLSKSYRRGDQVVPVLMDITLDIPRGDFIALMGPSGSGKSTLLNLIAGIDKPDAGTLLVDGEDITQLAEADLADWRAGHVGFIFQFYNLMPVLTAFENVELPLQLTSLSRRDRKERVETALGLVGLGGMLPYPVKNDSTSASGAAYTGAVVQYAGDGIYDPHAIYSQLDAVKYQYGCFFETFAKTGTATIPAPAALGTPCPTK